MLGAFERAQIPIDYLVGTSVGAAAGGLYALGYKGEDGIHTVTAADKKPRSVEFADELPKNAAGKVLRRVLKTTTPPA